MKLTEEKLKAIILETVNSEFKKEQTLDDMTTKTDSALEKVEIALEDNPYSEVLHNIKDDIIALRASTEELKELLYKL